MRVLLQHPHAPGAISGVVTYCLAVREMLAPCGVEVRIFSSERAGRRELWRAVRDADLVHLNSHHLRLACFARLLGKPVLIKYHYPVWDEATVNRCEPVGPARRLWRDTVFNWRYSAPDGLGGQRWRHNASRLGRALLRLVIAGLMDLRLACSGFIVRTADLPLAVELDYNPAKFPAAPPAPPELAPAANGGMPVFFFAGRLHFHKGVDVLLDAAARLARRERTFRVAIAGSGPEDATLRAQAATLGLDGIVDFLGRVPQASILGHLETALATIVPSVRQDSAPSAIVEAATCGRCCIGADAGGIPELAGAAGLLFPIGDAEALAAAMARLLDEPEGAARRGAAAYAHLRAQCDYAVAGPRLLGFYRRLRPDAPAWGRNKS